MNLYIDAGNTKTKIAFGKDIFYIKTKEKVTIDKLYDLFPKKLKEAKVERIIGSSVVPKAIKLLDGVFKKYYKTKVEWLGKDIKSKMNLTSIKGNIGADIVALAAYVHDRCDEGIIVNMGTATTITHVKGNKIQGVIICAGIEAQYHALIESTSMIDDIRYKYINKKDGKNTADAVSIGIVNGHMAMVKGLIKKIGKEIPVMISGGNSNIVKGNAITFEFVKEATIEGLKVIEKSA